MVQHLSGSHVCLVDVFFDRRYPTRFASVLSLRACMFVGRHDTTIVQNGARVFLLTFSVYESLIRKPRSCSSLLVT